MLASSGWLIGVLLAAWLVPGGMAAAQAVMYKRDSRSAVIWAFISLALPIIGPWLYWALGINRIERRALRHLGRRDRPFDARPVSEPQSQGPPGAPGEHLLSLRTVADRVTRLPLLPGNLITPLHCGEAAYPQMLEAIHQAEQSVTLASYIFDWDKVGHDFAAALEDAAGRGVRVYVLVDGIGALQSFSRMGRRLLKSGAEVAVFFPLRFPFGRLRLNLRNHRKIMVVDGRRGFTGGMNISERYLTANTRPTRVEDLHFEIGGPVVSEMQHTFVEDWATATSELLTGEDFFPPLAPVGPAVCRGISSGPDEDLEIIHWIMQAAFSSARHRVRIVTPYFVPTWPLISSMAMAALRGVDVALLLPSKVDLPYMRWAADAYLWQLLEHDIAVYRRPPPFAHTKLLLVDDEWVLLGSANVDQRSFRLHFEFNIEAYDRELAGRLGAWLDEILAGSERVTLKQVDSRPAWRRLRDGIAKIASPHL